MHKVKINLTHVSSQKIREEKPVARSFGWLRNVLVIVSSIIITAVGIKATDKLTTKSTNTGLCPDDMVEVVYAKGNFCIDKYESSASETCPYQNPASQMEVLENIDTNSCQAISAKGKLPWRYISQNQAAIACARAGKRLPTSAEWQQAALGTPDKNDSWNETDCNVAKNWPSQSVGETGSGINCKSASGVYDLIGNVWEWTSETASNGRVGEKVLPSQGYVKGMDDAGLPSATGDQPDQQYYGDFMYLKNIGIRAVSRGGYWGNEAEAGIYATHIVSEPSYSEEGTGFRCVK